MRSTVFLVVIQLAAGSLAATPSAKAAATSHPEASHLAQRIDADPLPLRAGDFLYVTPIAGESGFSITRWRETNSGYMSTEVEVDGKSIDTSTVQQVRANPDGRLLILFDFSEYMMVFDSVTGEATTFRYRGAYFSGAVWGKGDEIYVAANLGTAIGLYRIAAPGGELEPLRERTEGSLTGDQGAIADAAGNLWYTERNNNDRKIYTWVYVAEDLARAADGQLVLSEKVSGRMFGGRDIGEPGDSGSEMLGLPRTNHISRLTFGADFAKGKRKLYCKVKGRDGITNLIARDDATYVDANTRAGTYLVQLLDPKGKKCAWEVLIENDDPFYNSGRWTQFPDRRVE